MKDELIGDKIKKAIKEQKKVIETMIEYMQMKMEQRDWHAVADAAMDLRDIESYIAGLKKEI